jgi:cytochrome c oxidase assembly protein subunit 15
VRVPSVSPNLFRRLAIVALAAFAAIIVTGGAVRLTGSGLGCPDWPSCYQHGLTAQLSFHPMVEFVNRCITAAVGVLTATTMLAAWLRSPRRRDLLWLSGGLVAGLVGQAVLGGLVVLFHLNPYLVMAHLLFSLVIVVDGVVLVERAGLDDALAATRAVPLLGRDLRWLLRLLLAGLALVITAGTAVTGAGPHAGDPGAGVRRIPVAFRDVAELHSTLALFLIGMTLAALFALRQVRAPLAVQRRAQLLLEAMALQGVLGYTQYLLHDDALVVGFHIAGATVLVIAATFLYLSTWKRVPVQGFDPAAGLAVSEARQEPALAR